MFSVPSPGQRCPVQDLPYRSLQPVKPKHKMIILMVLAVMSMAILVTLNLQTMRGL